MPVSPTIDELESGPDFEKVLTLQYNDIAPFVIGRFFSFTPACSNDMGCTCSLCLSDRMAMARPDSLG